jgi:dTDP-4-dehydrorhamnose reductase
MELRELAPTFNEYDFSFLSRDELDIANVEAVQSKFDKLHPAFCINCAAYTAVDKAEAEEDEAFRINAMATGIIAAACSRYNTQLIHISTDYVYDGDATVPYHENAEVNPINVYGDSKLEGEKLALANNPNTIIIRTSWVYSSYGKNFVKTMLRLMSEKDEIKVVNDQYGSPTYAADLAEAILTIITSLTKGNNKHHGIYHYSNAGAINWYEFAIAIKELSGSSCKVNSIPTSDYPTVAGRPRYSVLDKAAIQKEFGIVLKDWKESLKECLKKLRE